jgi:CDP-glucose 4,6-dehydratase
MNAEFWREKRVLVTGHTGFKGTWLTLWLNRLRAQVTGYALAPPTHPSLFALAVVWEEIDSVEGNILDLTHLSRVVRDRQPSVIFHLAAQSLVRQSYRDPLGTYSTNVMGTANLLEAVRDVPSVKAVVVVTTDKCYENQEQQAPFRETDSLGGNDPYSSSKAAAELVTAAYRHSFFQGTRDVPKPGVASARAGNVIGGGDWAADRLIPDVVRAVAECKEILIRNPGSVRPWQHVLDPLHGYLLLAEKLFLDPKRFGQSWNFGPDASEVSSVSSVLDLLRELWGPEVKWRRDESPQPHEAHYLRLDSTRAKTQLGWEPRWDLRTGMEATVQWYRAYIRQDDLRFLTLQQIRAYQAMPKRLETPRT